LIKMSDDKLHKITKIWEEQLYKMMEMHKLHKLHKLPKLQRLHKLPKFHKLHNLPKLHKLHKLHKLQNHLVVGHPAPGELARGCQVPQAGGGEVLLVERRRS